MIVVTMVMMVLVMMLVVVAMIACRCGMCFRVSCSSCTLAEWSAADTGVGIQLEGGPGKVLHRNTETTLLYLTAL